MAKGRRPLALVEDAQSLVALLRAMLESEPEIERNEEGLVVMRWDLHGTCLTIVLPGQGDPIVTVETLPF